MNMPNSSYAIDSAWFSLRKRDEKDDYDLTPTMSEEDQKAAARYIASMSPEKQAILQRISDTFHAMPPDAKGQLTGSAHRFLQQYEGRLGDVLPQLPNADGGVAKFVPLVIGAVFALDALNQSQGAQGSLVGNVFTSIGNTISGSAGGDPNLFGETNYDDIFEYENQSSLVNPITGQSHAVVDNPSFWERTWMGAASTAGTFLNPFAVAGAGVRGTGRVAARAGEGAQRLAGRATQKVGEGISRLSGVAGRTRSEQLLSKPNIASRFTDAAGRGVSGAGAKRIAGADAAQAARREAYEKFAARSGGTGPYGKVNRLAGGGARTNVPYRALQGFGRTPLGQEGVDALYAGLGAGALSQLPDHSADFSGGYGGSGNVGAYGAVGGAASGFGTDYGMGNLANVSSNLADRREIFNPYQDYSSSRGQLLAGRGMEGQQGQFAGFGTIKGEHMFVNKIGDEIMKELTERIHKANCGSTELKADCPKCGKECKCDEAKKADDKKKPAHGMVIVIGSKGAGPGPSKDGKREKLDSEKKE
jgi:hypothetical protein